MKVYRIENANGDGPYKHYSIPEMIWKHNGSSDHPTLWADLVEACNIDKLSDKEYLCGFQTLTELHIWFLEFLGQLIKLGFRIVEIEVPEEAVLFGKKQLCFDKGQVLGKVALN